MESYLRTLKSKWKQVDWKKDQKSKYHSTSGEFIISFPPYLPGLKAVWNPEVDINRESSSTIPLIQALESKMGPSGSSWHLKLWRKRILLLIRDALVPKRWNVPLLLLFLLYHPSIWCQIQVRSQKMCSRVWLENWKLQETRPYCGDHTEGTAWESNHIKLFMNSWTNSQILHLWIWS